MSLFSLEWNSEEVVWKMKVVIMNDVELTCVTGRENTKNKSTNICFLREHCDCFFFGLILLAVSFFVLCHIVFLSILMSCGRVRTGCVKVT